MRFAAMLGLAVAGTALVAGAALVVFQRRLLYHPVRQAEGAALSEAEARGLAAWRDGAGTLVGCFESLAGPKRLVELPGATHGGVDLRPEARWWDEAVEFLAAGR